MQGMEGAVFQPTDISSNDEGDCSVKLARSHERAPPTMGRWRSPSFVDRPFAMAGAVGAAAFYIRRDWDCRNPTPSIMPWSAIAVALGIWSASPHFACTMVSPMQSFTSVVPVVRSCFRPLGVSLYSWCGSAACSQDGRARAAEVVRCK